MHLDAIQEVLGGTWINHDNPVAVGCGMESDSGFYYNGGRVRTEVIVDYDAAGDAAAAYWKERGFDVRSGAYRPTHRLVSATSPNGTTIHLTLEDNRNDIGAEGPCNEGNWGDVSDQDVRRLEAEEQRTPTPGRFDSDDEVMPDRTDKGSDGEPRVSSRSEPPSSGITKGVMR